MDSNSIYVKNYISGIQANRIASDKFVYFIFIHEICPQ